MRYWKKLSQEELRERVFHALEQNINYEQQHVLGVPASFLDDKVFNQDASFLEDAPFMSTLTQNPNHIGCHTLGQSEAYFSGTQEIERELIQICAVDILKGKPDAQDGYVAAGGTEANIQAIWIYRNFFAKKYDANLSEICIICSSDSHYSVDKAANLLSIGIVKVAVDPMTRQMSPSTVLEELQSARQQGKRYFIGICNMMTTMYGSIDEVETLVTPLESLSCKYMLHVDGAYGGFYYPFTHEESSLTFANPRITSFTLDAHKMAQAPYGTGIFLIRKGFMEYANTSEASYVKGEDYTFSGSRSGANAVAVWMILSKNGPYGWFEKVFILQKRASWMEEQLHKIDIAFYRHPMSNIITIDAKDISSEVADEFGLVPDDHDQPAWYKIVIMEHVTIDKLLLLIQSLEK